MKIPSDSNMNVSLDLLRSNSRDSVLGENLHRQNSVFSDVAPIEGCRDYASSDVDCGEKILDMVNSDEFLKANGTLISAEHSFRGEYSAKLTAMFILEPLGL